MPKQTRKQLAEQAEQARESRIRAALHWTEEAPGPDVLPPTGMELATGYLFSVSCLRVDPACTSFSLHSAYRSDKVTTQGSRRLYSTRLLALRALRNAVERECADRLAKVDQMIEDAID